MLCWEKSSTFCVQSIDIDPIPCYCTTHADYFYGEIPSVRCLTKEEINSAYEENTCLLYTSEAGEPSIIIHYEGEVVKLYEKEILYLESLSHYVTIYTKGKDCLLYTSRCV